MAYFTFFLPKISDKFTKKIPTFGEGGGVKSVGPNSQLLPKNCSGGSPKGRSQKGSPPKQIMFISPR